MLTKVLIPALVSPVVAGLAAFCAVRLIFRIVRAMGEGRVETDFRHGQTVTACLVALSHGTNDAQKTMGIITLTLIAVGLQPSGSGPELWVVAVCGFAIALGTCMGGWRVIRTLGKGLTEISTPQGLRRRGQLGRDYPRVVASGFALSTTQVCSGSIIGSGLGKKGGQVSWNVAGRMLVAWLVTFPAARRCGGACVRVGEDRPVGHHRGGVLAVLAAFIIVRLSHRNPVNSANVNESGEVKVNASSVAPQAA